MDFLAEFQRLLVEMLNRDRLVPYAVVESAPLDARLEGLGVNKRIHLPPNEPWLWAHEVGHASTPPNQRLAEMFPQDTAAANQMHRDHISRLTPGALEDEAEWNMQHPSWWPETNANLMAMLWQSPWKASPELREWGEGYHKENNRLDLHRALMELSMMREDAPPGFSSMMKMARAPTVMQADATAWPNR